MRMMNWPDRWLAEGGGEIAKQLIEIEWELGALDACEKYHKGRRSGNLGRGAPELVDVAPSADHPRPSTLEP
jgi:hypothetical protein